MSEGEGKRLRDREGKGGQVRGGGEGKRWVLFLRSFIGCKGRACQAAIVGRLPMYRILDIVRGAGHLSLRGFSVCPRVRAEGRCSLGEGDSRHHCQQAGASVCHKRHFRAISRIAFFEFHPPPFLLKMLDRNMISHSVSGRQSLS